MEGAAIGWPELWVDQAMAKWEPKCSWGSLWEALKVEDKQLVFHVEGNKEQVARLCKGWLQQEPRKMVLAETLQMDIGRRKLPYEEKRKRCFVILTWNENLDVDGQILQMLLLKHL